MICSPHNWNHFLNKIPSKKAKTKIKKIRLNPLKIPESAKSLETKRLFYINYLNSKQGKIRFFIPFKSLF
jgi:hypothetical protein